MDNSVSQLVLKIKWLQINRNRIPKPALRHQKLLFFTVPGDHLKTGNREYFYLKEVQKAMCEQI